MSMQNCSIDSNLAINTKELNSITVDNASSEKFDALTSGASDAVNLGCWDYWERYHYPYIVKESYPVYIQERAQDKGKQAFEIIKVLKDKKLVQLKTVGNFIDLMDELIKIL